MDEILLEEIYNKVKKGYKVAFATITKTIGSTPGKMGATIAVFEGGNVMGTVGGGMIEHKVINKCIECLKSGDDCNFEYTLNDSGNLGMQCGGTAYGYIKIFKPKPKLLIIGGGHIGLALFKIAKNLDFYTVLVDDREEFANTDRFENADEIYAGDIAKIVENMEINDNTYVIIATRGYEGDLISLRSVINRNANYIGMIGSRKKWIKVKETLIEENVSEEKLDNVYAPVGINISSNDVDEIAFGIMAEILLVKNRGTLNHRRDK
ncbi:XdhC/CoxI family protein [Terrisporobacter petrolearius]|uniref:XdhC family protein n=1 Tax=Terrisporobacter petrolearius TaxID=1460447 RepID=UPI0031CC6515